MPKAKNGPHQYPWTIDQDNFLIENFRKMTNKDLAAHLGLTLTLTRTRLYKLGYKRMELEYWTDEQVDFLRANYKIMGDVEIAGIFSTRWPKQKGWSKKHIEKKRRYLKLKRTPSEIKNIHSRNVNNGLFKMCPVNAWKKRGVSKEGEIRYWRRVGTDKKFPVIKINGRFVHYAPYRYEQLYGPIPEGMNVIFQDGNSFNLDEANLLLIDNAELSKRNSVTSSQGLSDNYVVGMLSHKDKEARKIIKTMPELIEIKRQQLLLQRELNKNNL